MATTLNEQKIKNVVQKTVREELMRFFDALLPAESMTENDVLKLSREARSLRKAGKLPTFESLADL